MNPTLWLGFLVILLVTLAVPGPDLVVVLRSGAAGTGRSIATAAGVVSGLCVHATLAIAGVTALVAGRPGALAVIDLVGGAVLVWLGMALLRDALGDRGGHAGPDAAGERPSGSAFLTGFTTNVTNPKALLFFAAVLPRFIGTGQGRGTRTLVLAATVVVVSALWWSTMIVLLRRTGLVGTGAGRRWIAGGGGAALLVLAAALLWSAASAG